MKTLKDKSEYSEIQIKINGEWRDVLEEHIRVKPKPMEIWVNVYPSMAREMFDTLATAKRHARTEAIKTIKFIQAPDDEQ